MLKCQSRPLKPQWSSIDHYKPRMGPRKNSLNLIFLAFQETSVTERYALGRRRSEEEKRREEDRRSREVYDCIWTISTSFSEGCRTGREEDRRRKERDENDKLWGKDKNTGMATTQRDLHLKLQDEEATSKIERSMEEDRKQMADIKKTEKQKEKQIKWEEEEEWLIIEENKRKLKKDKASKLANAGTEWNKEKEKTTEKNQGKAERKLVKKNRTVEQVRKQKKEESTKEVESKADVEKIEEVLGVETEQLEETEARIKDLEASIFSLDLQLERLEIEKM